MTDKHNYFDPLLTQEPLYNFINVQIYAKNRYHPRKSTFQTKQKKIALKRA